MYVFTNQVSIQQEMINQTLSGAVCINDCMFHVAQHDMPFGGIGNSGMGHYHAKEGFLEFTKLRPVFKQAKKSPVLKLAPPYSIDFDRLIKFALRFRL
jgi:coniferyl-aldehyde dehydrogenase